MTNFELFDNSLQAALLLVCAAWSGILALKKRDIQYTVLALAYLSWAMGTSFFMLHIAIYGTTPHIFYVGEISWISAYLFFLTLCLMRIRDDEKGYIPAVAFIFPALIIAIEIVFAVLNGSVIIGLAWSGTMAAISFCAMRALLFRRKNAEKLRPFDIMLLTVIFLQCLLFVVSAFTSDYTSFNLYFAVDLSLTGSLIALLPLLYGEATQNGQH